MRGSALAVLFLSCGSGATDGMAFLLLGHVFTSAMTGNTVLLGIALAQANLDAARRSGCALAGFVLGVAAASLLGGRPFPAPARSLRSLYVAEAACTLAFALAWAFLGPPSGWALYAFILLSSLAMGIQGVAALATSRFGTVTIVFTTALLRMVNTEVRAAAHRPTREGRRQRSLHDLAALVAYALGVLLAAVLIGRRAGLVAWLPFFAVAAAAVAVWLQRFKVGTTVRGR